MSGAFKRFLRVFVAGAIAGGIAALRGDTEFAGLLLQYGWIIPVLAGAAKYLRDKFGWTWLPI